MKLSQEDEHNVQRTLATAIQSPRLTLTVMDHLTSGELFVFLFFDTKIRKKTKCLSLVTQTFIFRLVMYLVHHNSS